MSSEQDRESNSPSGPILLRDELVEILAEDLPNRGEAENAAQLVLENRGDSIYTDLVWNLTNLRYESEDAKRLWKEVLEHKYLVSERLGRNVGIRVAALDYFANILGKLARPRVVDPNVLERLYRDAILDPLTGLANRRHYRERLNTEIVRARRYRSPFVLAIFDIDNFKSLNDTRGHAVGDDVLRMVAGVMREAIRESDLAARWGGEEFVLLMPETPKAGGLVVAERIRLRVEDIFSMDRVTISGGIASFPSDGENEDNLFSFADRALYRAKSEGKNRICPEVQERRTFARLPQNFQVRIALVPSTGQEMEGHTSNISGGGIAFVHDMPLAVTSQIRGEISLRGTTVKFLGRIVHVHEIAENCYDVGVQFLDIKPEDRDLILSFTI